MSQITEFIRSLFDPVLLNLSTIWMLFPPIFTAVLVLIVGWLVSVFIRYIVLFLLRLIKFDLISDKIGFTNIIEKGGIKKLPSDTVSTVLYWVSFLLFFSASIDVTGFLSTTPFINQFIMFIPKGVTFVMIILIGTLIGMFISQFIYSLFVQTEFQYAGIIKLLSFLPIFLFSVLLGSNVLGIESDLMIFIFKTIIAGLIIIFIIPISIGFISIASEIAYYYKILKVFNKGDKIRVNEIEGVIREIKMFNIEIITKDGRTIIPNRKFFDNVISKI